MNLTKKLDIHIEADFGSDFQKEIWSKIINLLIETWIDTVKQKHKKNRIFINGREK